MRHLKIIEHVSLDGVMQSTGEDGFPYADWTVPYRTPAGRERVMAAHGERFDLLLGRRTYDLWSDFWPKAPSSPLSDRFNGATKHVATHRPESLAWGPFEPVGPDIAEQVARLKSTSDRDLIVAGSSTLTAPLIEHGLADELMLIVYPVLLGTGKRFISGTVPPRSFELVGAPDALPSGVVLSSYKFVGALQKS